jgi:hypothetical protein
LAVARGRRHARGTRPCRRILPMSMWRRPRSPTTSIARSSLQGAFSLFGGHFQYQRKARGAPCPGRRSRARSTRERPTPSAVAYGKRMLTSTPPSRLLATRSSAPGPSRVASRERVFNSPMPSRPPRPAPRDPRTQAAGRPRAQATGRRWTQPADRPRTQAAGRLRAQAAGRTRAQVTSRRWALVGAGTDG